MSAGAISQSGVTDSRYSAERPSSGQQSAQVAILKTQVAQDKALVEGVTQAAETIRQAEEASKAASRPGVGEKLDIRV